MPAASFTWYVPATRASNFAFNVSGAYIKPYGGKEIPIFLRERLGGDRSVRGYKFGAIVPVEYKNGKYEAFFDSQGALLGGDKMYYFNAEYVYALAGPLKAALFFDAGNTWIESQAFTPLKLQACYGVEARIFLPIFQAPLRFIYAINPNPIQPLDQYGFPATNLTEKKSGFTFSIGRTF